MNLKVTPATDEEIAEVLEANDAKSLDEPPPGTKVTDYEGWGAYLAELERARKRPSKPRS